MLKQQVLGQRHSGNVWDYQDSHKSQAWENGLTQASTQRQVFTETGSQWQAHNDTEVGKQSLIFHHEVGQGAIPSVWTDRHIGGVLKSSMDYLLVALENFPAQG